MRAEIFLEAGEARQQISPLLYGHFIENLGKCIYGGLLRRMGDGWEINPEVKEALAALHPTVIRWPGGLFADGYHWRDGVGPLERRRAEPNRYWRRLGPLLGPRDPNWFGTDEFIELCREVGAQPLINVNYATGTPAEAAEWVRYCEGRVPWWGIGNEQYGFWALGHSSPGKYAQRYLEFRKAMLDADPDIRTMVVGTDGIFVPEWNRIVLDAVGEEADLLSFHVYLPGFERVLSYLQRERRDPEGVYYAMVGAGAEVERRISWTEDTLRGSLGAASHVRLALDEWNIWWKPSQTYRAVFTMREALAVAGILNALHRNAHIVEMANIAQLVNVLGLILVRGDSVRLNAIYHPFLLFAREAGRFLVPARVEVDAYCTPALGAIRPLDKVPYLDVSATLSLGKDRLAVFMVNRHLSKEMVVGVEWSGFMVLWGKTSSLTASSTADSEVRLEKSELPVAGSRLELSLPPHSITVLVIGNA
jgi:alpha-L-arabinofuranosidase